MKLKERVFGLVFVAAIVGACEKNSAPPPKPPPSASPAAPLAQPVQSAPLPPPPAPSAELSPEQRRKQVEDLLKGHVTAEQIPEESGR